jgi:ParB-like chromosome segregation protein Spo0J
VIDMADLTPKQQKKLQNIAIDKLMLCTRNARTHSEDQIIKLQASIKEFGFVNPILIDSDFNIIAGHGRLLAAKKEGLKEVPCVCVNHLTEVQKRAYIIADNRLALDAGWDMDLLKLELAELKTMDFNLDLTGFDNCEIDLMFEEKEEKKAIDLDESESDTKKGTDCHCPKCGFVFNVNL